ncbi:hypothetical protein BVRB_6g138250 [Beta vulgaris subsp. vulgaris]|nr:hypothetical protein BVRB_6g138250 [Beta vulgaris subsp. vulgaris]
MMEHSMVFLLDLKMKPEKSNLSMIIRHLIISSSSSFDFGVSLAQILSVLAP